MKIIYANVGSQHPPHISVGAYTAGRMLDLGSRPFLRIETMPGAYRLIPLDSPQIFAFDFPPDDPEPLKAAEAFASDFARITGGDLASIEISETARRALSEIATSSAPLGSTIPISG